MAEKMKANQSVKHSVVDRVHTFKITGQPDIVFDERTASEQNCAYAMSHGWKQRFSDAAAISKTDDDGKVIPDDERNRMKWAGIEAMRAHYSDPEQVAWELPRVATGPRIVPLDVILEAICRAYGKTPEQRDANLTKMVRERGGDIESNAREFATVGKVMIKIAEVEAERRAARMKGDGTADALFDEMMSDDAE